MPQEPRKDTGRGQGAGEPAAGHLDGAVPHATNEDGRRSARISTW